MFKFLNNKHHVNENSKSESEDKMANQTWSRKQTMYKLNLTLDAPSLNKLMISYTRRTVIETEAFQATCILTRVKNKTINYRWMKNGVHSQSHSPQG